MQTRIVLLFLGYPALATAALMYVERRWPSLLWPIVAAAVTFLGACAIAAARQYSETSPLTVLLWSTGPVAVAAAVLAWTEPRAWSRRVRWLTGSAVGSVMQLPLFALSCVLAEWLPVPRCFF